MRRLYILTILLIFFGGFFLYGKTINENSKFFIEKCFKPGRYFIFKVDLIKIFLEKKNVHTHTHINSQFLIPSIYRTYTHAHMHAFNVNKTHSFSKPHIKSLQINL